MEKEVLIYKDNKLHCFEHADKAADTLKILQTVYPQIKWEIRPIEKEKK